MSDRMMQGVRAEFARLHLDLGEWIAAALVAIPYALGWLAGALVRGVLWIVAAMIAGYKQGRGL